MEHLNSRGRSSHSKRARRVVLISLACVAIVPLPAPAQKGSDPGGPGTPHGAGAQQEQGGKQKAPKHEDKAPKENAGSPAAPSAGAVDKADNPSADKKADHANAGNKAGNDKPKKTSRAAPAPAVSRAARRSSGTRARASSTRRRTSTPRRARGGRSQTGRAVTAGTGSRSTPVLRAGSPFGPLSADALRRSPAGGYVPPQTTTDVDRSPTLVTRVLEVVPPVLGAVLLVLAALSALLAGGSVAAAIQRRRLLRQRELLRADVGLLQSALLPVVPSRIGGVTVSAAYRPASGPAAGGDFYDLFALDD